MHNTPPHNTQTPPAPPSSAVSPPGSVCPFGYRLDWSAASPVAAVDAFAASLDGPHQHSQPPPAPTAADGLRHAWTAASRDASGRVAHSFTSSTACGNALGGSPFAACSNSVVDNSLTAPAPSHSTPSLLFAAAIVGDLALVQRLVGTEGVQVDIMSQVSVRGIRPERQ